MGMVKCPDCGNEISANAKACPKCGCEVTVCPDCLNVYAGKPKVCKNCGYNFNFTTENANKTDVLMDKANRYAYASKILKVVTIIASTLNVVIFSIGVIILFHWINSEPLEQVDNYKNTVSVLHGIIIVFAIFLQIDTFFILLSDSNVSDNILILQFLFSLNCGSENADCLKYCKQNLNSIGDKTKIKQYKFIMATAYYQKNPERKKLLYIIDVIAVVFSVAEAVCLSNFLFKALDTVTYNIIWEIEIKFTSFDYIPLIAMAVLSVIRLILGAVIGDYIKKDQEKWLKANSLPVNIG